MTKENIRTIIMLILIAGIIVGADFLLQEIRNTFLSPKEVVQKFIDGDMAGAFVGGKVSKKSPIIEQYLTGTDGMSINLPIVKMGNFFNVNFEVVDNYKIIGTQKETNDVSYVTVSYHCNKIITSDSTDSRNKKLLIKIDGYPALYEINCQDFYRQVNSSLFAFDSENNIEKVTFQLIKDGNNWKINDPQIISHVSNDTYNEFQKDFITSANADKILTPEQVVKKYVDIIMSGVNLYGGSKEDGDEAMHFLATSIGENSNNSNRIFVGSYFTVIKNYEIISKKQSHDINNYYVKIKFYCDKIISSEPRGLKSEKGIKASDLSGGEPTFFINNCLEFYNNHPNCLLEDGKKIKENEYDYSIDCKNGIEIFNLGLIKEDNVWKINAMVSSDHISIDAYNKWLGR